MGREIRRVPPNWNHPKMEDDEIFQPMHDCCYAEAISDWIAQHQLWEAGQHPDQLAGHSRDRYYAQYGGNPPSVEYYRPDWKPEEMTWYQVYETVSEGTPVSPPFETQQQLIKYLVENGDFWDQKRGDAPWSRVAAERFVLGAGRVPSGICSQKHGFQSGIQALENND